MIGLGHVLHLTNTKSVDISKLCGVTPQTINKWVQSIKPIPEKYSPLLENKFNVPFSLLRKEMTPYDRLVIDVLLNKDSINPRKLGILTSDLIGLLRNR